MTRLSGSQHLLDSVQEPVAIGQHDVVKVFALRFIQFPRLQSFQVEADGSEWRLEFMSYSIDEGIVLLVATNFADEEGGVKHHAHNDQQ